MMTKDRMDKPINCVKIMRSYKMNKKIKVGSCSEYKIPAYSDMINSLSCLLNNLFNRNLIINRVDLTLLIT